MELQQWAAAYVAGRDVSGGYADQLRWCAAAATAAAGGPVRVAELSVDCVNGLLRRWRDAGLAGSTRRNRRRMLLTLWQAAADRGLAGQPARRLVAMPKAVAGPRRAWTVAEVSRLVRVAEAVGGPYWASYVRAAWDSGLRGCDLRRLERSAIGPDGRAAVFQVKTQRPVCVHFRASTLAAIAAVVPADRRLCWPMACGLRHWRAQAARLVRRAGLAGSIGQIRAASGTAVEILAPGQGHLHLGNTRAVFLAHYLDPLAIANGRPRPPELP